jgi:hypothetical protein
VEAKLIGVCVVGLNIMATILLATNNRSTVTWMSNPDSPVGRLLGTNEMLQIRRSCANEVVRVAILPRCNSCGFKKSIAVLSKDFATADGVVTFEPGASNNLRVLAAGRPIVELPAPKHHWLEQFSPGLVTIEASSGRIIRFEKL